MRINRTFARFSDTVSRFAGKPLTFLISFTVIIVWAVTGPLFHYSDAWQLVINTGTTIITFLMVFVIQNSQNRDGAAIQAKLDELIRSSAAQNNFIGIEALTTEEVAALRDTPFTRKLSQSRAADAAEEMADEKAKAAGRKASD